MRLRTHNRVQKLAQTEITRVFNELWRVFRKSRILSQAFGVGFSLPTAISCARQSEIDVGNHTQMKGDAIVALSPSTVTFKRLAFISNIGTRRRAQTVRTYEKATTRSAWGRECQDCNLCLYPPERIGWFSAARAGVARGSLRLNPGPEADPVAESFDDHLLFSLRQHHIKHVNENATGRGDGVSMQISRRNPGQCILMGHQVRKTTDTNNGSPSPTSKYIPPSSMASDLCCRDRTRNDAVRGRQPTAGFSQFQNL